MGCFNTIGFHSHLPITYGKDVVVFLGVYATYENRNVRRDFVEFAPGNDFTPIALPIFGKYDDYGSVCDIERDANIEAIEKFFGFDIDKIVGFIDDYMHGRYQKEEESKAYDSMCKKIYDMQAPSFVGCDYKMVYELTFTMDHRFVYDTIKDLNMASYDFEKSYEAIMELYPPWEIRGYDGEKLFEAEEKYKRKEIDEYTYELEKNRVSFFNHHSGWLDYLNRGKCFNDDSKLSNIIPYYCRESFWGYIDEFDTSSVMIIYRSVESMKILFDTLRYDYFDFLKFIDKFRRNHWCFRYHVYGSQGTHCTSTVPYYDKLMQHCMEIARKEFEEDFEEEE